MCSQTFGRSNHALAAVILGVCSVAASVQAGPRDIAVYVTRLGGDAEAAKPYLDKFTAYVETEAGWPKGSAHAAYLTSKKETMAYLESTKPGYGFIEPQLYLELRKTEAMEPIVQIVSKDLTYEKLHVIVKDPAYRALGDLKGKRLWTMLADSPRYLSRVVLDGQVDAEKHFQLKQIGQAMKGVRAVLRGEADATVVDTEQLEAARKLEGGEGLKSVFDSHELPPLPVVAFGKTARPEERKRLIKVLLDMCGTPAGGEVCKDMHISKFTAVGTAAFLDAQKRYDQP